MSYSGELIAVPAVLAIEAVIQGTSAVAKAVGSVATAGARAVHSAVQTAVVHKMQSNLGHLTENASRLNDRLAEEMEEAVSQCYADYERIVQKLEEDYAKNPDTSSFLQDCRFAQKRLYEEIQDRRTTLETTAIAGIRQAIQNGQAENERQRRTAELSIQRISDEEERRRKAGDMAVTAISETLAMAQDFRAVYGKSQLGCSASDACEASLQEARHLLEAGLPEASMISAYSARDALLLRVSEIMEAECRNRQLYADCRALVYGIHERMNQYKSISYTFRETRNGSPRQRDVPDFGIYYRGAWETVTETLHDCEVQLSKEFHDYAPEQLQELLDRLSGLQNQFMQETELAYERLHNQLLREETGKLLFQRYRNLGYRPVPLTEEDMAISPLDALVLRLEKEDTSEKLYLRLNAVPDADGHIAMHIQMEDHTCYDGTDAEIEQAREEERLANCKAIENSSIGKQLRLKQRCSNPGVRDAYQQ